MKKLIILEANGGGALAVDAEDIKSLVRTYNPDRSKRTEIQTSTKTWLAKDTVEEIMEKIDEALAPEFKIPTEDLPHSAAVKRLALVLSVQAEIEGMKAENARRESEGMSQAWCESNFYDKAQELADLAKTPDYGL